ncbi:intracellular short-chain-length polyhydroxyalkanoate depolymerase [Bacillus infantis]|uniref:intracellular short-chain-length polyhydroxyalkanoate depolymerase n=1 Tax=Bacillus infantis TaxID=324767 RepID=UPI00384DC7B1
MNNNIVLKKVALSSGETISWREREGGRQKLLLIHGNMTSSKHWDLVFEHLDPKYKLYAVDLRGFGQSTYFGPIRSIKDFSDDVKLFCDAIGLSDFSVAGWSTGGAVAMQLIADNPGICNRLILLASASTRGYPFYGTSGDGVPDSAARLSSLEQVKADRSKTIPVQSAYDRGDRVFLRAMWDALIYDKNQPEPARYEEYLDDMLTQRNLAEVYHSLNMFNISSVPNGAAPGTGESDKIKVPVLVLRGDRDQVITAGMAREILEDIGSNARFAELKDCGHSPLVDDIRQLTDVMSEFLDKELEVLK